jgi:hypothetical protein
MWEDGKMADTTGFRKERIEKLLHELRYEIERGTPARDQWCRVAVAMRMEFP